MGHSILSRNSSGGGAERIGDIRLSTRDSLGEKWVLADGRADPNADNSNNIEPDFANINCWSSDKGFNSIISDPSYSVYAGDGIWYFLYKYADPTISSAASGSIYKYNMNTGSWTVLISDVHQYNTSVFIHGIHFDKITKNIILEEREYNRSFSLDFIYFDTDGNFIKKIAGRSCEYNNFGDVGFIASHNDKCYNYTTYDNETSYMRIYEIYEDTTSIAEIDTGVKSAEYGGDSGLLPKIVPLYYNNSLYLAFISPYASNTGAPHRLYKVENSNLTEVTSMTMSSAFDIVHTSWDNLQYTIYGEGKLFVWFGVYDGTVTTLAFDCEAGTITCPYIGLGYSVAHPDIAFWNNRIYLISSIYGDINSFNSVTLEDEHIYHGSISDTDTRLYIIGNPQDQYDSGGCFLTSKVDTATGKYYVFNSNIQPECLPNIQIENTNAFIKVKE